MSKTARRLGRGLDSLVSNLRSEVPLSQEQREPKGSLPPDGPDFGGNVNPEESELTTSLPTSALQPNSLQPRTRFTVDNLSELAESIRVNGVLQPIIVRKQAGRYEIVAGERRWRAAREAGLRRVPVVVRAATDEQMLEFALIENIQREDLNAIERAKAYQRFSDEFGLRADEVAQRTSENRSTVVNYLRLLELDPSLQDRVAGGEISMGHARSLVGVAERGRREELARRIVKEGLSVRALEEIVRRNRRPRGAGGATTAPSRQSAHITDMQRRFEQKTRTKVSIHEGHKKGTGRIVIEYYSLDDFDRLARMLGVNVD